MIESRKTSPPAAYGPTHHCMVHVYTLWLLIPVSFHTQTGNGTLIPHADCEWDPHSTHRLGMVDYYGTLITHADWEWDPHSTHRLGTAFQTGNGNPHSIHRLEPHSIHRLGKGPSFHAHWEWDPHSTHRLRKTEPTHSHIISKVHTVEVHNAARDVDGDKQSWSQFSCIVKPKF